MATHPKKAVPKSTRMATHPKKAVPKSTLEAFEQATPPQIIAMMLWKARHQNGELAVIVTEDDIKAYSECMEYLKATPEVKIVLRKKYVGIVLVEKDTGDASSPGNAIKPIENNEVDADKAEAADRIRRIKERAPDLANRLKIDAQAGTFSSDMVTEAADTILTLVRA